MTREQAKDMLPFITAFAAGKTIQYKTLAGGWKDGGSDEYGMAFDGAKSFYRIKPEPRDFYLVAIPGFSPPGPAAYLDVPDGKNAVGAIHVREVL